MSKHNYMNDLYKVGNHYEIIEGTDLVPFNVVVRQPKKRRIFPKKKVKRNELIVSDQKSKAYEEKVLKSIKSKLDIYRLIESKTIYVLKFTANKGNKLRTHNNYCEIEIRVNKENPSHIYSFVMNEKEIKQIISMIKKEVL